MIAWLPSLIPLSLAMWLWQSMMPGLMCRPLTSTTVAPAGTCGSPSPTETILPSRMMTNPCAMTPFGPDVQTVALVKATVGCSGGACVSRPKAPSG